eukprot:CAMPEP_0204908218 /NCGR_PEP_ID=MMETSP1397-20131031/7209_1 /ASSEMBLY_ACC=CAM_ASM_000891 /TAXON_ID=49980 /ORGANISM="Climacostomum Climacostomum virens, Strain Stock W-24" /LENGTH=178 /DNA_ID=CAMNT_0052077653 /DNA_START=27 /DNA_END=559 /DNA_ORIENTATION=+
MSKSSTYRQALAKYRNIDRFIISSETPSPPKERPVSAFKIPSAPRKSLFPKESSLNVSNDSLSQSFNKATQDIEESASAIMEHISRSRQEKHQYQIHILAQQQQILNLQSELLDVQQRLAEAGMQYRAYSSVLKEELEVSRRNFRSAEFNKLADEVIRLRTALDCATTRLKKAQGIQT